MGIRTLIIDDENLARERLRGMLEEQEGIEIVGEASNGIEAIEKIRLLQPDLAFMDIEMPGFNGFKVVQALNAHPIPKIIFVTAYNQYAIDAFEIGAIDYLLKPVKKDRLVAALQRIKPQAQDFRHDLVTAREVQKRLLPSTDLKFDSLEIAGACIARNEVGGDYYDLINLSPSRLGICIADISGKGFSAALMMANLQAMLRVLSRDLREPATLISEVNKAFYENSIEEMFATLFFGVYDKSDRSFTFCNAGHNPPLFFQNGALRKLHVGGTVVGMFADSDYEQASISLGKGDTVVLYSDGLVELSNEREEDFGEERIISMIQTNLHLSSHDLKNTILDGAHRFCPANAWQDDLTVVVLKSKGGLN